MAIETAPPPTATGSLLGLLKEGKPSTRGWIPRIGAGGVLGMLLLFSPYMVEDFQSQWIALGMIYVMVGISLNILLGYAGQVSLGHQAFVGVGAFTSAILVSRVGLTFWIALLISAATGALAAFILGLVALRLKGLYLALITLAYGEVAEVVIFGLPALTGGGAGTEAPRPAGFVGNRAFVYLCFIFVALLYYLDWRLTKSKAGRAIFAIRENEIAAASFGINVVAYKLLAFVISGAFAGIAGSLFAHYSLTVVSTSFNFTLALTFVLMVVVGGLGSRPGIFIGCAFFAIFPLAAESLDTYTSAIGALLLLLTLTMYPGGIGQQIKPFTDWFAGKRFTFKGHGDSGVQAGGAGVRP